MRREAWERLLLSGLCFALAAIARLSPDVCAWYADRVFPAVRQAFFRLNEAFAAWPALALGLLCAAIFARRQFFTHLPGRLFTLLLSLLLAFCALWLPLYGVQEPQADYAVDAFSQAQGFVEALNRSAVAFPQDVSDVDTWAKQALDAAQDVFSCRLSPPAIVRNNALLDRLGVAGIHNPLTGRTHVNADDRPLLIPFTLCHELAHPAGIAREDLANRAMVQEINVLRKRNESLGGVFEASANLQMLLYAAQELPEEALADLTGQMKEAVRREFVASNGSGKHIPALQRAFQRLSDGFLRLCGVSRGEKSYSDVLLLIPRS